MKNTKDKNIRAALKSLLIDELHSFQKETGHPVRIISELGVDHGIYRIDVVSVNSIMHGYEIKSDADTLDRLPEQAEAFSRVFDRVTLVVGESHIIKALSIIPDWWGVKLARGHANNTVSLNDIRSAIDNTSQDMLSLVRLLWRQEALDILLADNKAFGVKTKRRESIYQRLVSTVDFTILKESVQKQLFTRQDWQSDWQLLQCDD